MSRCVELDVAWLASVPQVFSTHITTGRYSVYALVMAADERSVARLLVDELPRVAEIRAVQTAESGLTQPEATVIVRRLRNNQRRPPGVALNPG
jgi:predicted transcriptional regulator